MRSLNVKVPAELIENLEACARHFNCHRSTLVRRLLTWSLDQIEEPQSQPEAEQEEDYSLIDFEF